MSRRRFWIGDLAVDPGELRITHGEIIRPLTSTPMRVLLCLRNAEPQVVTKEQLLEEVWEGQIVSDEVLYRAIRELRVGLADVDKRIVETVPRRGYRLNPVEPDGISLEIDAEPLVTQRSFDAAARIIVRTSPAPMLYVSPTGEILACNNELLAVAALSEDEVVGVPILQYIEALRPRVPAHRWKAFIERSRQSAVDRFATNAIQLTEEEYFDNRDLEPPFRRGLFRIHVYAWHLFSDRGRKRMAGSLGLYRVDEVDCIPPAE